MLPVEKLLVEVHAFQTLLWEVKSVLWYALVYVGDHLVRFSLHQCSSRIHFVSRVKSYCASARGGAACPTQRKPGESSRFLL